MAQNQEVLSAIREHLKERGVAEDKVSPDAKLLDDLDLDSLDTVELTLALEQRFGIEVDDSELEDVVTIGDAAHVIEEKLRVQA